VDLEENVGVDPAVKERCESCGARLTADEIQTALEGASDAFLCARCAAEQVAVADEPEEP
jgi:predicted  nucleic acid-binding Zn-ribbon protein